VEVTSNGNDIPQETPLLGDVAFPIPMHMLPCQEIGLNNRQGTMLPEGVWKHLECMEYEPQQQGGLDAFFGDPVLAIWEKDVQYFGIQFGGDVDYHQVKVTDCLCLDWQF